MNLNKSLMIFIPLAFVVLITLVCLTGCEFLQEAVTNDDTAGAISDVGEQAQEVAPYIPAPFGTVVAIVGALAAGWRNSQARQALKEIVAKLPEKDRDELTKAISPKTAKLIEKARPDTGGSLPTIF